MPPGDSDIRFLDKGVNLNPFKSRSTIICLACLVTLLLIATLAMYTGFFNTEFSFACLMVLREIIALVFGHQVKADSIKIDQLKK